MDVFISHKAVEIGEELRRAAEEKIARLGRYLPGLDRGQVHFSIQRNPRIGEGAICEVVLEGHGHHVRCKANGVDHLQALDRAHDKLNMQLHKLKSKLLQERHGAAASSVHRAPSIRFDLGLENTQSEMSEEDFGAGADIISTGDFEIVKVKRFALYPMLPEEAASRMDLMGHGFFLFTNVLTSRSAVVYRRDDGDIGLIDEDDDE